MTTTLTKEQSAKVLDEWKNSPETRAKFGNHMTKFIIYREAEHEWMSPAVQREHGGNFDNFLAYKTGVNAGRIKILGSSENAS